MNESNASLETSRNQVQQDNSQPANKQQQGSKGAPENEPKKALTLAELFADDSEDSDESPDDESKPIDSLDTLLKRTKLKPEEAYAIRIPMPNGAEPLTLGELKDRVGELVGHEQSVLQFDQRRVQQEGEILQAQQEIRDLLGLLPKDAIKPEMVNKLRQQAETKLAREVELTRQHIPAWNDSKVYHAEFNEIREYLKRWGFPESYADTIQDHRALKFVRDSWLRDKRIAKALEGVKPVEKRNKAPSSKAGKAPTKTPNSESTRRDGVVPSSRSKLAAIFK
jgi:hypothetical protein